MRLGAVVVLCALAMMAQRGAVKPPAPPVRATGATLVPSEILDAEAAWAGPDVLLPMLERTRPSPYAARALGRLENPSVVPRLLTFFDSDTGFQPETANAIAQSLKNVDPHRNPELVHVVAERLRIVVSNSDLRIAAVAVAAVGRIAYANPSDVTGVERALVDAATRSANELSFASVHSTALRSLEWLFRLNLKTATPAPATLQMLAGVIDGRGLNDTGMAKTNAFAALLAARGVDADSEKQALASDEVELRRLAVTVLTGSGGGLDDGARNRAILESLRDRSPVVRFEAVRAYARHSAAAGGCDPLVDALKDEFGFVAIAGIDALATACPGSDEITNRLVIELRTPSPIGPWTRQAHALVAVAKRSRDAAAISLPAFASHQIWQVRMYAARAAAVLEDGATLEKLALDDDDNVREATLEPLRTLGQQNADDLVVAALRRPDYQLVRTAANLLKASRPSVKFVQPLVDALKRITAEGKETSRDIRVALLEAIEVHANADSSAALERLAHDFDPVVAARAAALLSKWSGSVRTAEAVPRARSTGHVETVLHQCVSVQLRKGRLFRMDMNVNAAPLSVRQFLRLAVRDHYYDGLSFHRVVPNFVIQGGGPGANEYSGARDFMRDEISAGNVTGSVGLSTRGRNTADAQFFVNLVDNTRLDYDYTVFANVFASDMPVVYAIEEGDEIESISTVSCDRGK